MRYSARALYTYIYMYMYTHRWDKTTSTSVERSKLVHPGAACTQPRSKRVFSGVNELAADISRASRVILCDSRSSAITTEGKSTAIFLPRFRSRRPIDSNSRSAFESHRHLFFFLFPTFYFSPLTVRIHERCIIIERRENFPILSVKRCVVFWRNRERVREKRKMGDGRKKRREGRCVGCP